MIHETQSLVIDALLHVVAEGTAATEGVPVEDALEAASSRAQVGM